MRVDPLWVKAMQLKATLTAPGSTQCQHNAYWWQTTRIPGCWSGARGAVGGRGGGDGGGRAPPAPLVAGHRGPATGPRPRALPRRRGGRPPPRLAGHRPGVLRRQVLPQQAVVDLPSPGPDKYENAHICFFAGLLRSSYLLVSSIGLDSPKVFPTDT